MIIESLFTSDKRKILNFFKVENSSLAQNEMECWNLKKKIIFIFNTKENVVQNN